MNNPEASVVASPIAQIHYEEVKQKSHFLALQDQLRLIIEPEKRLEYARIIDGQAKAQGLNAITLEHLKTASELTIANLYHYVQENQYLASIIPHSA